MEPWSLWLVEELFSTSVENVRSLKKEWNWNLECEEMSESWVLLFAHTCTHARRKREFSKLMKYQFCLFCSLGSEGWKDFGFFSCSLFISGLFVPESESSGHPFSISLLGLGDVLHSPSFSLRCLWDLTADFQWWLAAWSIFSNPAISAGGHKALSKHPANTSKRHFGKEKEQLVWVVTSAWNRPNFNRKKPWAPIVS